MHETGALIWGTDGPPGDDISGGTTTTPLITSFFNLVGDTKTTKYDPIHDVNAGTYTYRWDVTFTKLQDSDVGDVDPMIPIGAGTTLQGTNVRIDVEELVKGTSRTYQRITAGSPPLAGTFALKFRGEVTTGSLNHNATDSEVDAALESLSTIGGVTVTRGENTAGIPADGHFWDIVFDENLGQLPTIEVVGVGDTALTSTLTTGTMAGSVVFSSPSKEVSGNMSLSYATAAKSPAIPHDASPDMLKRAIEDIPGMPAGLVSVSRSEADYNGLYEWRVTFITLRGDLLGLVPDTSNITCSRGVATGPGGLVDLVEFPSLLMTEDKFGTRVGGSIELSFPTGTAPSASQVVGVEISESGMLTAIDSLLMANGFAVVGGGGANATTRVVRVGPNHDGAYRWTITIQNLGDVPALSVDTTQMTCGSAPNSILAGCNPSASATTKNDGSFPWRQQISLDVTHALAQQRISVGSHPFLHEVQEIRILDAAHEMSFSTSTNPAPDTDPGSFRLSFGVHTTAPISLRDPHYVISDSDDVSTVHTTPSSSVADRVRVALEAIVNVDAVEVTQIRDVEAPSDGGAQFDQPGFHKLRVTFTGFNGDVPLLTINTTNVVPGDASGVTATVVERVKGVACEEQSLELIANAPGAHGVFTCTFSTTTAKRSAPVPFNASAADVQAALSMLPLLGPVSVSLAADKISTSGASYGPAYRRWDVTFKSYVGTAPLLSCQAAGTTATTSGDAIRVVRTKQGESTPVAGSFTVADAFDPTSTKCESIPVGAHGSTAPCCTARGHQLLERPCSRVVQ